MNIFKFVNPDKDIYQYNTNNDIKIELKEYMDACSVEFETESKYIETLLSLISLFENADISNHDDIADDAFKLALEKEINKVYWYYRNCTSIVKEHREIFFSKIVKNIKDY